MAAIQQLWIVNCVNHTAVKALLNFHTGYHNANDVLIDTSVNVDRHQNVQQTK